MQTNLGLFTSNLWNDLVKTSLILKLIYRSKTFSLFFLREAGIYSQNRLDFGATMFFRLKILIILTNIYIFWRRWGLVLNKHLNGYLQKQIND